MTLYATILPSGPTEEQIATYTLEEALASYRYTMAICNLRTFVASRDRILELGGEIPAPLSIAKYFEEDEY